MPTMSPKSQGESPVVDPSVMPKHVVNGRTELCDRLLDSPIPRHELIRNLGLYMLPMEVRRTLFFSELYQQIVNVPGVIMEFGTRWGQNLAIMQLPALRPIVC